MQRFHSSDITPSSLAYGSFSPPLYYRLAETEQICFRFYFTNSSPDVSHVFQTVYATPVNLKGKVCSFCLLPTESLLFISLLIASSRQNMYRHFYLSLFPFRFTLFFILQLFILFICCSL